MYDYTLPEIKKNNHFIMRDVNNLLFDGRMVEYTVSHNIRK